MLANPISSIMILSVFPVAVIIGQIRKRHFINKIYNFGKELKQIKRKKTVIIEDFLSFTYTGKTDNIIIDDMGFANIPI